VNKFTLNVFKKLFTLEERTVGLIQLPGEKKNKSKRVFLDQDRLDKLRKAVEIKWQIAPDKKEKNWKKIRDCCNRNCYDEKPKN
jgi:hypothetical protein